MTKALSARLIARAGLILILAGATAACDQPEVVEEEVIRPVRAIKVADPSAFEDRTFPGRARATREVNVAFEVTGRVVEYPIDVGDVLQEGDVIARLDPRDFRNALDASVAELARATAQRDRVAEAAATGAVSQQDLTDAEAAVQVAEARRSINAKALEDTVIRAPFSGSISAKYVENFQNIAAKQPIARILDTSKIEMVVNIPESLISLIPFATDIWVRYDAFPDHKIPARLLEIGTEASETTRTFPVTVIMDQPEGFTILPGMAGRSGGSGGDRDVDMNLAVNVPASAIFTNDDGSRSYVWVVDESAGTVSRREIQTGALANFGVSIDEGIEPGEWVATAGVHFLAEGQKVTILEDRREEIEQ